MAQLSDDCFAFGGELMPAADALARLAETTHTVAQPEEVSLSQAHGRVLAGDVLSTRDVPPHDNAAVDGWAVYFDDLNSDGDTRLPWSERIPAGRSAIRLSAAWPCGSLPARRCRAAKMARRARIRC